MASAGIVGSRSPSTGRSAMNHSAGGRVVVGSMPRFISPPEIADFCAGEAKVTQAVDEYRIENKGFNYNCIAFLGKQVPNATDSAATCAQKLHKQAGLPEHDQSSGWAVWWAHARWWWRRQCIIRLEPLLLLAGGRHDPSCNAHRAHPCEILT